MRLSYTCHYAKSLLFSFAVTTILSGDSREAVVEKIHNHLVAIGEQVRDNRIQMEDYLITKVTESG